MQAQIHLIGNLVLWYSGTISLVLYLILLTFYLIRRRRHCYDLDERSWQQFRFAGEVFLSGYCFHYIPYFFVERTLFLHHYLPALIFKTLLCAVLIEHLYFITKSCFKIEAFRYFFILMLFIWIAWIFNVFKLFMVLCYGTTISSSDIISLRWKDTWDFIVHK